MVDTVRWSEGRADTVSDFRARKFLVDHGLPEASLLFEADQGEPGIFATDAGEEVLIIGSFDEDFYFFVNIRSGRSCSDWSKTLNRPSQIRVWLILLNACDG